jgi:pimeloyl-ACP methyl ester carboxylesterase
MVAAKSQDISFIVLMAGPGLDGGEIIKAQQELILKSSGYSENYLEKNKFWVSKAIELVRNSENDSLLKTELKDMYGQMIEKDGGILIPDGQSKEVFVNRAIKQFSSPWMQYFIKYDPVPALEITSCPVLALNGEKDLQVPYQQNLARIENALKKAENQKVTIKSYPDLNHLFQECVTGNPSEYAQIEQTISPEVLKDIVEWITILWN